MRQNPMMALTVAAENVLAKQASREGSLDIESRLELFVDDYLIDELLGTRLVLHHPRPAEVALRFDRPWEGAFCAYVTVLHDGDIYRSTTATSTECTTGEYPPPCRTEALTR